MHKNSTVIDTLGCMYEGTVCMWYSWSVVQYVCFVRKINNFLLLFKHRRPKNAGIFLKYLISK